jgi:hypothetical protein
MTKKQFRKSRRCINATKFARVFTWIRLFVTMLSFLAVYVSLAWVAVSGKMEITGAEKISETLKMVLDLLQKEPASLFSLKAFGAFGTNYWDKLLAGVAIDPVIVTWVALIVGFFLTCALFNSVKKSKQRVGAFFVLFLFAIVDTAMLFVAYGIPKYSADSLMIYIGYGLDLIMILSCFRAMICGAFLNRNYEKGMRLEKYNLRKIYREQRKEPPIEMAYMTWNR